MSFAGLFFLLFASMINNTKKEGTTCEVSKNLTGLRGGNNLYFRPVRSLETSEADELRQVVHPLRHTF